MEDLLKKYCARLKINLIYTNNKVTILSSGIQNNIPVIRVHRLFKNCPEETANAIIGFYSDFQNQDINTKLIVEYIREHFSQREYKIIPADEVFKSIMTKNIIPIKSDQNDDSSLVELDITSITLKNLWGDSSNIKPGDSIKTQNADVSELDIVVDPFKV